MSKETKIGLLVGLLFIVVFGLVLSHTGSQPPAAEEPSPDQVAAAGGASRSPVRRDDAPKFAAGTDRRPVDGVRVPTLGGGGTRNDPLRRNDLFGPGPVGPGTTERVAPADPNVTRVEPKSKTYTIKSGDRIGGIMKEMYGSQHMNRYDEVLKANNATDRTLRAGKVLNLPTLEIRKEGTAVAKADPRDTPREDPIRREEPKDKAEPRTAGKSYTVKSGDSLYKIAAVQLKDPGAVNRIMALNHISNPKQLKPGMVIKLP